MTAAALVARGLSWSVDGRDVVRGVDLDARGGDLVGLLGPNGSGKSTVLRLTAGLQRADAGTSHVDGTDVLRLGARARARLLALLEQEASTDLDLTARDVVALGRAPHRDRWPGSDPAGDEVVRRALCRTGGLDLAERRWQTLSGGERQRVHLARALAQEPRVLLLDEPTNHLDLRHQLSLLRLVRSSGVTAVAALHDLALAAAFCDRLVVLSDGEVVAVGPPAEVLTAELVGRVWGVDVTVVPHPATGGPLVVWDPEGS